MAIIIEQYFSPKREKNITNHEIYKIKEAFSTVRAFFFYVARNPLISNLTFKSYPETPGSRV